MGGWNEAGITTSLVSILDHFHAPSVIDYLSLDVEGNVLPDAHVGELTKANVGQVVGNRLALRVKKSGKRLDVYSSVKNHGLCRWTEADEQCRRQRVRN